MGTFSLITGQVVEPVSVTEVKDLLGITHDDDDVLIDAYIKSATTWAESYTGLYLMTQVVELTMDKWPGTQFDLGVWPIQSIDSIKYYDTSSPSVQITLTEGTNYMVDTTTVCGRIWATDTWPSLDTRPNAIAIRMTVGYADSAASPRDYRDQVPEQIKTGIKFYVKFQYESDPCSEGVARTLLHPYRKVCRARY